jgi:hypothetical protein
MSCTIHHAAVIVGYNESAVFALHDLAIGEAEKKDLPKHLITDVVPLGANMMVGFSILPSGSKSGWETSEAHVEMLEKVETWAETFPGISIKTVSWE